VRSPDTTEVRVEEFAGRTAIVTGAASGIGNAVAQHFAERGARVVGVDRSDSVHDAVGRLPGAGHHGITADLTAPDAAERVVAETLAQTGAVDILVNSAGVVLLGTALTLSADAWQTTLDVNLTASFRMAQAVGAPMTEAGYGRIVNLASQASVVARDQHVACCASKAAIVGMTKVLSMEWARFGVTVNAVSPTVVETPLGKKAWAGERGEAMKKLIPTGRFAQPEEVAALIGYLAGAAAGMITGENILIDGGYTSV
jgi:NAD(P)-dependent dehydrogenase (short-subunit alcohol dehydrogenase family)